MTLEAAWLSLFNGPVSSGQEHNLWRSSSRHYLHSLKIFLTLIVAAGMSGFCLTVSAGGMAVKHGHILLSAVKYIFQVWKFSAQGLRCSLPGKQLMPAADWFPPAGK